MENILQATAAEIEQSYKIFSIDDKQTIADYAEEEIIALENIRAQDVLKKEIFVKGLTVCIGDGGVDLDMLAKVGRDELDRYDSNIKYCDEKIAATRLYIESLREQV